jgi:hypothetical protein
MKGAIRKKRTRHAKNNYKRIAIMFSGRCELIMMALDATTSV